MSLTVAVASKKAVLTVVNGGKVTMLSASRVQPAAMLLSVGVRSGPAGEGLKGDPGDQHVFVQDSAPNFNGLSGLWVQTGLPGGGMTIWIEDGL